MTPKYVGCFVAFILPSIVFCCDIFKKKHVIWLLPKDLIRWQDIRDKKDYLIFQPQLLLCYLGIDIALDLFELCVVYCF